MMADKTLKDWEALAEKELRAAVQRLAQLASRGG